MKCSNKKCKKEYDLKCLNIELDIFKTFTREYKDKWICPECICSTPKQANLNTPVRVNKTISDTLFTPSNNNINTQRGSQSKLTPSVTDTDSLLLEELRALRSEIISRLDSQENEIKHLQNLFSQTKTDLENVILIMQALESKVIAKIDNPNRESLEGTTGMSSRFCSQSINDFKSGQKKRDYEQKSHISDVNNRVAIKPAIPKATTYVGNPPIGDGDTEKEDSNKQGWTVQNKKGNRRLSGNDIRKGQNTSLTALKGAERKKYLHVWRLHPDTTLDAVTNHIKDVCGSDVITKIERIKHKTERDYASFIVGVPEQMFTKLNKSEVWPLNAEFSEWIWFRKSERKTPN